MGIRGSPFVCADFAGDTQFAPTRFAYHRWVCVKTNRARAIRESPLRGWCTATCLCRFFHLHGRAMHAPYGFAPCSKSTPRLRAKSHVKHKTFPSRKRVSNKKYKIKSTKYKEKGEYFENRSYASGKCAARAFACAGARGDTTYFCVSLRIAVFLFGAFGQFFTVRHCLLSGSPHPIHIFSRHRRGGGLFADAGQCFRTAVCRSSPVGRRFVALGVRV